MADVADAADQYRRRADAFERLVAAVAVDDWDGPSPCAGWTARGVVAHVVDYSGVVLRDKAGLPDPPVFGDFDDPASAFQATRSTLERILDDVDTPPKVVTHLVWSLSFDLPQHGWDLAVATRQEATMDPAEVALLWGSLMGAPQQWDWQRANGWYGRPIAVADEAPLQDRVLGLLGRDPAWRPPPPAIGNA